VHGGESDLSFFVGYRDHVGGRMNSDRSQVKVIFPGVYQINGRLFTRNLFPGTRVYNEQIVQIGGVEYRSWNPYRSKLAAAIRKGLNVFPLKEGDTVLYLGASTGTTSSHVSDIVGKSGMVYCVEFSPQMMKRLLEVCKVRENMIPLLADARHPEEYSDVVSKVDVIYEDVAQPDQDDILITNAKRYLKPGGYAFFAIKSQSIDVAKDPEEVYKQVRDRLSHNFEILDEVRLDPFEKDHLFMVLKYKGFE